jgi:hypothetical protein
MQKTGILTKLNKYNHGPDQSSENSETVVTDYVMSYMQKTEILTKLNINKLGTDQS